MLFAAWFDKSMMFISHNKQKIFPKGIDSIYHDSLGNKYLTRPQSSLQLKVSYNDCFLFQEVQRILRPALHSSVNVTIQLWLYET